MFDGSPDVRTLSSVIKDNGGFDIKLSDFKLCRKKIYTIWTCRPAEGTLVINSLESPDILHALSKFRDFDINRRRPFIDTNTLTMLRSNPKFGPVLRDLQEYVKSGQISVVKGDLFVMSGTIGEMWTSSLKNVQNTYLFVLDNGGTEEININTLKKRGMTNVNPILPWTKVKVNPNVNKKTDNYMACFIPKQYRVVVTSRSGSTLTANSSQIRGHGKGDFLLCRAKDGEPNFQSLYIINGMVFANTYDNRGWSDYLDTALVGTEVIRPVDMTNNVIALDDFSPMSKYKYIMVLLGRYKKTADKGCKFNFRYNEKEKCIVVEIAASDAYIDGLDTSLGKFKKFSSVIVCTEDSINISCSNVFESGRQLAYKITFKAEPNCSDLEAFRKSEMLVTGLMGYVQGDTDSFIGVTNADSGTEFFNKYEYDGVESYTVSNSGMARLLRYSEHHYEHSGTENNRLKRCISGIDRFLERHYVKEPFYAFRGTPLNTAFRICGAKSIEELKGKVMTNVSFTSVTVNLHTTTMFDHRLDSDSENGLIIALRLEKGLKASYLHPFAGWKGQYEVLLDRCYDIELGEEIFSFKSDNGKFTHHVVQGRFIKHKPFGKLPSYEASKLEKNSYYTPLEKRYMGNYDSFGRSRVGLGSLYDAFVLIREDGCTGIQYQDSVPCEDGIKPFIIINTVKKSDSQVNDIGLTLGESELTLDIYYISGEDSIRNYWVCRGVTVNRDTTWDDYAFSSEKGQLRRVGKLDMRTYSPNAYNTYKIKNNLPELIMSCINKYIRDNRNKVGIYNIQDVARYLDTIFRELFKRHKYYVDSSDPIYKKGSKKNENAGFVSATYRIIGVAKNPVKLQVRVSFDEYSNIRIKYVCDTAAKAVEDTAYIDYQDLSSSEEISSRCKNIIEEVTLEAGLDNAYLIVQVLQKYAEDHGYVVKVEKHNISGSELTVKLLHIDNEALMDSKQEKDIDNRELESLSDLVVNLHISIDNDRYRTAQIDIDSSSGIQDRFDIPLNTEVMELYRTFESNITFSLLML